MQEWLNCVRCGERYKSFLSTCPRCGYSNKVSYQKNSSQRSASSKVKIVGAIVVVGGILFLLASSSSLGFNILPVTILPAVNTNDNLAVSTPSTTHSDEKGEEESAAIPIPTNVPLNTPDPVISSSHESIEELREYVLAKINHDRAEHGLAPVALSDNKAAQAHAQDLFETLGDSSHWTSDGMKPYMRYTVYGGTGYVSQNVHSGLTYSLQDIDRCKTGFLICEQVNIYETLAESEYSMMYDDAHADWGHRDNILDKHHTHVSIGVVYDDYYFAHVQNFENNYINLYEPITYNGDDDDNMLRIYGEFPDGNRLYGIYIYHDEPPTAEVYKRDRDLPSYGMGEIVAGVTQPGRYFEEIVTINAERWSERENVLDVIFDISSVIDSEGVYTLIITLEDDAGEQFPALSYSIFI